MRHAIARQGARTSAHVAPNAKTIAVTLKLPRRIHGVASLLASANGEPLERYLLRGAIFSMGADCDLQVGQLLRLDEKGGCEYGGVLMEEAGFAGALDGEPNGGAT